ncbi:MAG TPA: hypothetical protein VFM18_15350 [Methanosarcina sp.]|nr:hypothetical protein [Methanosarcina sp.]
MSMLSELRKNKSALLEKVNKAMQADSSGGEKKDDDRFWQPTRDQSGNGSALIRFLPPLKGDELPWVKVFSRSFKNETTGKWYINNDLSTIGRNDDPVYLHCKKLYDSGLESDKKIASPMKRKTHFISNVLIIKDPANPANDGTIRLFKYGKKIHEMIMTKANPVFEDEERVYVYDIDEGANFRLRIKTVDGYPNYDSSVFDSPSALCGGDDDKIQTILEQYISLAEFTDPKNFKTPEQLQKELDRALGVGGSNGPVGTASDLVGKQSKPVEKKLSYEEEFDDIPDGAPLIPEKKETKAVKETKKVVEEVKQEVPSDEDDDLQMFRELLGK